jgi:hypothetical protein
MANKVKPAKLQNVVDRVKESIEKGKYTLTPHTLDRQRGRFISLPETLHVLKTGYEDKQKTSFDEERNTWKYAIRGKTIRDELDVRVIVAFDEHDMVIITVMRVGFYE